MNRRQFLQGASVLAAGSAVSPHLLAKEKQSAYKLGYQLYSVNQDMNSKPIETLRALKAMGYQDFEIFGFDSEAFTYYGMSPSDFKLALSDLGLSVSSGHYGFSRYLGLPQKALTDFVARCIEGAHALNSPYITWPWIALEQRTLENYKLMTDMLNQIGEQVKRSGLGFAYHNHGFEFDDHNGENGFDIITRGTDASLVKLQMDMYWVMHSSSFTPQDLVKRHPGRISMWHIKDMDARTRDYTELGNGVIDYKALMPDAELSGLEYYYIEQGGNFTESPIKSAATSATYFKSHLQGLI